MQVGKELASRGHEFIAVNTDYDGQQFSKIDTTGVKQLLYKHPWTVASQPTHTVYSV